METLTPEQEEAAKLLFSAIIKIRTLARSSNQTEEIYDIADAIHNLPLVIIEQEEEWGHELVIARNYLSQE